METAAAVIVEGTAGAGKSALVQYAVDRAAECGWRVLTNRPAPADAELAMVGLTDLFASVDSQFFDELAPPLRHALEVVLLRRDPGPTPADARTVNTAVTAALALLCDERPLLIAVDDSLWLDAPSARTLAFAARRLLDRPVRWLLVARCPEQSGVPLDLDRSLNAVGFVHPAPLTMAAIFHVVQNRIGVTLSRPNLLRVHEMSAGNPLFAIELARSLSEVAGGGLAPPLEVPVSLRAALDARIAAVSEAGRAALRVAAAARHPRGSTVASLSSPEGLDAAEVSGVVRLDGERVVFDHPLLRVAVYNGATPRERHDAHAALAIVATDAEERGRHLALSSTAPSRDVALALDLAAAAARARGAPDVAAELAELAVARTPDSEGLDRWRRRIVLADFLFDAGATRRALDVVGDIDVAAVPGSLRVAALRLQVIVAVETEGADAALTRLDVALAAAGDDVALRVEALVLMSRITDDGRRSADLAESALDLLNAQPPADVDVGQMAEALLASAMSDFRLGLGLDRTRFERAIALEKQAGAIRKASDSARAALSAVLKYADLFREGRDALVSEYRVATNTGDESGLAGVLAHLPQVELFLGNWAEARRWADEHYALAQQTEQVGQICTALCNLAMVEAYAGVLEAATARGGGIPNRCRSCRFVDRGPGECAARVHCAVRRRLGRRRRALLRTVGWPARFGTTRTRLHALAC